MFKKITLIIALLSLNHCATPSAALLGPIFTGAKTGSIYQASLSYGSGKIMNGINSQQNKFKNKDNKKNRDKIFLKNNLILSDITYTENDPLIVAYYKVSKIKLSEVSEPEPLP